MRSTYLRFLSLARMASNLPGLPALDPVEERLLTQLAAVWANEHHPTVLETLRIDEGISPRTVQRRIEGLLAKGMIEYQNDLTDQRVKRIAPTKLAEQYFARLDQLMKAAQGGQRI